MTIIRTNEQLGRTSLYELTNSWEKPARLRFVENFSGDALDTNIWATTAVGSSTATMNDLIDGGVKLLTGTTANNSIELDFGGIYQFNAKQSTCIFTAKRLASAGSRYDIGFQSGYPNSQYVAHIRNNTNDTYYRLITSAGSTSNATDFSIAEDNDFHTGKIIMKESSALGYLDGVLEATNTSNLPQEAGRGNSEPFLKCTHNASAVAETRVTYLEAWET